MKNYEMKEFTKLLESIKKQIDLYNRHNYKWKDKKLKRHSFWELISSIVVDLMEFIEVFHVDIIKKEHVDLDSLNVGKFKYEWVAGMIEVVMLAFGLKMPYFRLFLPVIKKWILPFVVHLIIENIVSATKGKIAVNE